MRAIVSQESPISVSEFFARDVRWYVDQLKSLSDQIPQCAEPVDDDVARRLAQANVKSLQACRRVERTIGDDEATMLETQERFREAIQPWFDQSWFMERAKTKPRGYPGDYQTLIGIYDAVPRSTGLGGYLDRYFLQTPLAEAVRQRLRSVQQFLKSEAARRDRSPTFLNVACGPCREFTHGWNDQTRPVNVKCVDMDREAIAYADSRAEELQSYGVRLETHVYNALRMSSAANNVKRFGKPDVIYSVGLCDYLPDNAMIRILRGWRESLAPGGKVYVSFKDCEKYDKTGYAWHVDWHFIPRTENDCRRLFVAAGFDAAETSMNRSESPIIMNFVSRNVSSGPLCAAANVSGAPANVEVVAG